MYVLRHLQRRNLVQFSSSLIASSLFAIFIILASSQPANALPAFARKYGLRCSACHESWPMLNYFGQKFKDNGYQIMNDRDAPIWQNPGYWPVTFRITPIWHRVSVGKVLEDTYSGGTTTPTGAAISASYIQWVRPEWPRLPHWGHSLQELFFLRAAFIR